MALPFFYSEYNISDTPCFASPLPCINYNLICVQILHTATFLTIGADYDVVTKQIDSC